MPPRSKFTREEIVDTALGVVARGGLSALTARNLGEALGSSSRPIFTVFDCMEEVCREVKKAAMAKFETYAEKAENYTPVFKQVGLQMILFAAEQPKLFQLLFMSENDNAQKFEDVMPVLGDTGTLCIEVIQRDYALDEQHAKMLFEHCWIFTFGIGVMIATNSCRFTTDEISDMLSREFVAMLTLIKSGRADNCTTVPELRQ